MKMTDYTTTTSAPRWAGDFGKRLTLLSGGVKLDAASFPAGADGKRRVASGTLVSKLYAGTSYRLAVATDEQFAYVWAEVPDANVNNDAELYISGEVRLNRLPAAPAAALITATKQQFVYTEGQG